VAEKTKEKPEAIIIISKMTPAMERMVGRMTEIIPGRV